MSWVITPGFSGSKLLKKSGVNTQKGWKISQKSQNSPNQKNLSTDFKDYKDFYQEVLKVMLSEAKHL